MRPKHLEQCLKQSNYPMTICLVSEWTFKNSQVLGASHFPTTEDLSLAFSLISLPASPCQRTATIAPSPGEHRPLEEELGSALQVREGKPPGVFCRSETKGPAERPLGWLGEWGKKKKLDTNLWTESHWDHRDPGFSMASVRLCEDPGLYTSTAIFNSTVPSYLTGMLLLNVGEGRGKKVMYLISADYDLAHPTPCWTIPAATVL